MWSALVIVLYVSLLEMLHAAYGQMHCGPKISPRLLMEIPCDMSKSSYCSSPGSAYPLASVKRYIIENQGLMRRMYGEERQFHIIKNEIDDIRDKYDSLSINSWGSRIGLRQPHFSPRSASIDSFPPPAQQPSPLSSSAPSSSPPSFSTSTSSPVAHQYMLTAEALAKGLAANESGDGISTEKQETTTSNITEESPAPEEVTPASEDTLDETTATNRPHPPEKYVAKTETERSTTPSTSSSQTSAEDSEEAPVDSEGEPIPRKGVNACPVKEEVIAPYWANNTRGETLALLNVYPFEQYVHWEKCSFENSQMLCRDGCRCEQQYRLHRLLAFDPKNECRGIFADWFRFPSCCICICYDLPDSSIFYRINRRKSRL